jgi:hypothetical protein
MACVKPLSRHFPGATEETWENVVLALSNFEPSAFQKRFYLQQLA